MLSDWFTIVIQLVNFLILVWLLKRFLYKPILRAIDEREKHIANQIKDAEKSKAEANSLMEEYRQKNADMDQQRQTMLNNIHTEIESERRKLREQTHTEIENLRTRLHETLREEQDNIGNEIKHRTQKGIFEVARKALKDLAAANLEEQMADVFIAKLKSLPVEEKKILQAAVLKDKQRVIIRSALEIPTNKRQIISDTIKMMISNNPEMIYENVPQLVSGIELKAGGYKLEWSIGEYLTSLEASIAEVLNEK